MRAKILLGVLELQLKVHAVDPVADLTESDASTEELEGLLANILGDLDDVGIEEAAGIVGDDELDVE